MIQQRPACLLTIKIGSRPRVFRARKKKRRCVCRFLLWVRQQRKAIAYRLCAGQRGRGARTPECARSKQVRGSLSNICREQKFQPIAASSFLSSPSLSRPSPNGARHQSADQRKVQRLSGQRTARSAWPTLPHYW